MSRYKVLTVKDLPRLRSELEANGWQVTQNGNTLECVPMRHKAYNRKTIVKNAQNGPRLNLTS